MGTRNLFLGVVEAFSFLTAWNGLVYVLMLNAGIFSNIHTLLWFIFGILTNGFGLVAIFTEWWEGNNSSGGPGTRTVKALQYHYFFSWMNVLVGYAGLVTQTWMTYRPYHLSHMHLALIGIPLIAWLKRKSLLIVVTTQVVTLLAVLSHIWVAMSVGNWWGLLGALLMGLTMIAMSLPVRYTFFFDNFTTREAAILLSGIASFVFPCSIGHALKYNRRVPVK